MAPNGTPREAPLVPRKPKPPLRHSGWGVRPAGSGQEGWAGLTFTLPAFPLVAWLADAFVGLGSVLADGIDVAVVRALRALIHVDCPCWGEGKHW